MANDMGLAGGAGGSMAYQLLKDLLARRFTEEQAALKQQNTDRGFGLESEKLGLDSAKLGEDRRQFDVTDARDKSQFAEGAPLRTAQTANYNENVAKSQYDRSDAKRTADRNDKLIETKAQGDQQARVAGIRQRDRYALQDGTDDAGKPIKLRVDLDTGEMVPVRVIGGNVNIGKKNKLTATQQTEMANYDAVLGEGKRIQDALHASGLDKDNSPINARARSFIAQKLKVDTNDPIVDRLIQNVGFLQTVALRGAAGNQRLTNELMRVFQPHIGDTESSGARLATILPELMRQIGDRRSNAYRLAGVDDPNATPASGADGYDAYLARKGGQ